MNPVFARIVVLAFLVISTGIAMNALFLQDGRIAHNQGKVAGKSTLVRVSLPKRRLNQNGDREVKHVSSLKQGDVLDAKIRDVLQDNSGIDTDSASSNSTIAAIQFSLLKLGYQPGSADGIAGPTTRAAIMAYEFDRGLLQTGIADREILDVIQGKKSQPARQAKNEVLIRNSQELISALQKALTKLGYNTGSADGVMGPLTRQRIRSFERDNKLDITGRISGRLITAVTKARGRPLMLATLQ